MSHYVICLKCNEKFDRDKEPFQMKGRRYLHQACFDAEQEEIFGKDRPKIDYSQSKKANLRVCCYCGDHIDIKQEEFMKPRVNKCAHKACYEKYFKPDDKFIDEIYQYIKTVMPNYNYQQCENQRIKYVTQDGFTNEGILHSLKYYYGVKNQSPLKSGGRIGIVPYVYEEAQRYYKAFAERKARLNKTIEKQLDEKPIEIKVNGQQRRKQIEFIDLEQIGEE